MFTDSSAPSTHTDPEHCFAAYVPSSSHFGTDSPYSGLPFCLEASNRAFFSAATAAQFSGHRIDKHYGARTNPSLSDGHEEVRLSHSAKIAII